MTNALTTDFQTLTPSDGGVTKGNALIEVFELEIPNSDIGGSGEDKLYFHAGVSSSDANIQWYSLKSESNYGSTSSGDYKQVSYSAYPLEATGFERRATGTLPRPSIRFANINAYFNTYLSNFDDLLGAKIIRRRTLQKYLTTNPPVELHREIYYIERKVTENGIMVEFELASSFDAQGIKLPRRTIVAARCSWKYKDTTQGGCDWPTDCKWDSVNQNTTGSSLDTLYFNKDDTRIEFSSDDSSYAADTFNYWGLQGTQSNRTTSLYAAKSYAVDQYAEYQRPIGDNFTITAISLGTDEITYTLSTAAHGIINSTATKPVFVVIKGCTPAGYNYKQVPLYVQTDGVSGANITVDVQDDYASGSLTTGGYMQNTRSTLYKCVVAHAIATTDTEVNIIKPTNISYWTFGDICGKRLNSCATRFGFEGNSETVKSIRKQWDHTVTPPSNGAGDGYSSAPDVTVGTTWTANVELEVGDYIAYGNYHYQVTASDGQAGTTAPTHTSGEQAYDGVTYNCLGVRATATANLGVGDNSDKVVTYDLTTTLSLVGGSGYNYIPVVTVGAPTGSGTQTQAYAGANVNLNTTQSVDLPFGGFPGSALF